MSDLRLPFILVGALLLGCSPQRTSKERRDGGPATAVTASAPEIDRPPPEEVTLWLRSNAIRLVSVDPGTGFDDMEPLRNLIGGARVVAMGEATHGTHEFFRMKHRMFEFLVEKLAFRAFAIEGTFADALAIDEYVRGGAGDVRELVTGLRFWTWDTEEVVDLVEWMRHYNADPAHAEKLRFLGFDMQYCAGSVNAVMDSLERLDPRFHASVITDLEPLANDWTARKLEGYDRVRATVARIVDRFDAQAPPDVAKLGLETWALARVHAHVVAAYLDSISRPDGMVRDRAMADNVARFLDMLGPKAKIMLWAHNTHVQKRAGERPRMGHFLSTKLGPDYVVIGFAFDRGSFRSHDTGTPPQVREFQVDKAPAGSFDGSLATVGASLFALDLRATSGPTADWLHATHTLRSIGASYNPGSFSLSFAGGPPTELYDAVIFVEQTTAAHPTPAASKSRTAPPPFPTLTNGGFEADAIGQPPTSWQLLDAPSDHYRAIVTDGPPGKGHHAVKIAREPWSSAVGMAGLFQRFEAQSLRGKHVTIMARAHLQGHAIGDRAFLVAVAAGPAAQPVTTWKSVPRSGSWSDVATELDVPGNTSTLNVGLLVTGNGSALFGDIRTEIGEPR